MLTIDVVDVGDVVFVRVAGELDIASVPQLAAVLKPLRTRPCELDLGHVPFMDAAGLALLLTQQRETHTAGGSLRIVAPSRAVRHILAVTATTAILLTAPSPPHP